MEVTVDYSDLLDNTRIIGEKPLYDLAESDVERYLVFLGFPEVPSLALRMNREAESLIFMLSCKLIQDCNSITANKKKSKKELKGYHLKLVGYIILNLGNRRKLSVHNSVFLKLIEVERPGLICDFLSYEERLKNILYLSTSLYASNKERRNELNDQILFSYNELNEVTRTLISYMEIFKDLYKRMMNINDCKSKENRLIKNILFIALKQILILVNLVKRNNKMVNEKLLNQLLIFTYYLHQYRLNVAMRDNLVDDSEKENKDLKGESGVESKEEGALEENELVMDEIEGKVLEIVQKPIQSSMLELLGKSKNNKSKKGEINDKKEKKGSEETEEEQKERLCGLVLMIQKVIKWVLNNTELIHSVLSRIRELIGSESNSNSDYKEDVSADRLIFVRSYYRILLELKSGSVFTKYNTDGKILDVIKETLSFVISQLFVLYGHFNSEFDISNENDVSLRDQLEYCWSMLGIISNINLEFMDTNIEKIFKLLYLDFKWYSDRILSQKTFLFLISISKNVTKKSESDFKEVKKSKEVERTDKKGLLKEEEVNRNLPSSNFISDLIIQYNNMNQFTAFLEYVHLYFTKSEEWEDEVEKGGDIGEEKPKNMEEDSSLKRKLKDKKERIAAKRMKKLNSELRNSDNDVAKEAELNDEEIELNYMNNYIILRNIDQLSVNNNEIINAFKILEKYEYELYAIIVVYLSKVEFNIRNISKVAEQFVRLYKSLDFKCDFQSLLLMSQVIVTVRKLISYFNPIKSEHDKNEEEESQNSQEERKEDEEKELINKLLTIVRDVYKYVSKNNENLVKKGRNEVILSVIYHIMLVNNERFVMQSYDNELSKYGKEEVEKEGNRRVLSMDVNEMLSRLLGSSDGKVYSFIAKNMKLFNKNGKVDEFIWNHLELTGEDKSCNLNKKLSLIYFKRFLGTVTASEKKSDERELSYIPSSKDDLCKNANVFIENIIDVDNTEIINTLLSSISRVYKRLKVIENRRMRGDSEEIIIKSSIDSIVLLLEMLLYVMNYETLVSIKRCYRMIIGYGRNMENEESKSQEKVEPVNIFDVIITVKRWITSNEYYSRESEKKVINLFVKYYYTFTICILKYSSEDKHDKRTGIDTLRMSFKDSNEVMNSDNMSLVINTNESYKDSSLSEFSNIDDVNTCGGSNQFNQVGICNADEYVNSSGTYEGGGSGDNMMDIDDNVSPESQNGTKSTVRLYISSLLFNYLQPCKVKRSVKDDKRSELDVYFIYKYIDTMKLNNYNNYSVQLFKENDMINEILMSRQSIGREKSNSQKSGTEGMEGQIGMLYENIQIISNRYMANIALWNINSFYISRSWKTEEEEGVDLLKSESLSLKLYLILLKMADLLNEDNRYVLNLSKKNDELHEFLKNLLNSNIKVYNQMVKTSIGGLEKGYTEREVNKYIILIMLINNYNKDIVSDELYLSVCAFIGKRIRDMMRMVTGKIDSSIVVSHEVSKGVLPVKCEKKVCDEILFSYLIINKLYNINYRQIKNQMVELIQITLNVMSNTANVENVRKLTQIMLKLINTLATSNINRNINIIVYFYYQYNQIVLRRSESNCRELIRFTNLIVNANNYKYIKHFVPVILNISIQTYYYTSTRSEREVSVSDKNVSNFKDNSKDSNTDDRRERMLKNNILKCLSVCEEKVKDEVYKMIKNNQIKMFFKSRFQQKQ